MPFDLVKADCEAMAEGLNRTGERTTPAGFAGGSYKVSSPKELGFGDPNSF